jgi:hypothetical protein
MKSSPTRHRRDTRTSGMRVPFGRADRNLLVDFSYGCGPALPEATPFRHGLPPTLADAQEAGQVAGEAGPGGHSGATSRSSAADLHTPVMGSSDQPQPGPATPTLPAQTPRAKTSAGSAPLPSRRRTGAVKVERPTGRTTLTATSGDAHSQAPRPGP